MKHKKNFAQTARQLAILSLIFFACITSTRAQVKPFVDCVERVDADNYRVYFGYVSFLATTSFTRLTDRTISLRPFPTRPDTRTLFRPAYIIAPSPSSFRTP